MFPMKENSIKTVHCQFKAATADGQFNTAWQVVLLSST